MPVPITDANQFGPRWPRTCPGDCSDDNNHGCRVDVSMFCNQITD
jgi:hypothetical protein